MYIKNFCTKSINSRHCSLGADQAAPRSATNFYVYPYVYMHVGQKTAQRLYAGMLNG